MLNYDLAELYGYEVKALNQQMERNTDRFPEDLVFQLKKEEISKIPRLALKTLTKLFYVI